MSLAYLWQRQSKRSEAHELLAPIYVRAWHSSLQRFLSALYLPFCPFSILAQVSRSVTVRLNTSAPGRVSRSTQK